MLIDQDRRDPAGSDRLVDDQKVIYAAGNAVGLPGSQVLKWKAVLVDASQSGVEIGDDLLATDDEDDVTRSGDDWTELWLPLADAIKSDPRSVTAWTLPTTQSGAAER